MRQLMIGLLLQIGTPLFAHQAWAAETGSITGRITFAKGAVKLATIKAAKDVAVCGKKPIQDESLVVASDGSLANVVVSVEGAPATSSSGKVVHVDQKDCRYVPHVQTAPVGAKLELNNSDPVLHNVHAYVGNVTQFNMAMPIQNMKIPQKLDKTGVVRLKCDAGHTWMAAYIVVKPHALTAVTGADGRFRIDNVSAGTYKLEVWHEKLGTKVIPVTVSASSPAQVDLAW
ncbi:MAG: carboxypeptidase regulatory-like domain-containing protein [Myxococcota bacterium]